MLLEKQTVILGADHAGFRIKEYIKRLLRRMNYKVQDVGTFSRKRVDYPDYAEKVSLLVLKDTKRKGILACGTGIGASIAANKVPGIRAALVVDENSARLSREHNDANILVLGGRPFSESKVRKIIKMWLRSRFKGGIHKKRLRKISKIEERNMSISL